MENLEKDDLLFVTVFKSKNDQDIYSSDLFSADGPTELSDMGKLGLRRR